jgi:hypothetical protein
MNQKNLEEKIKEYKCALAQEKKGIDITAFYTLVKQIASPM